MESFTLLPKMDVINRQIKGKNYRENAKKSTANQTPEWQVGGRKLHVIHNIISDEVV